MATLDRFIASSVKHWSQVYRTPIDPALVRAIIQKESAGGVFTVTEESKRRRSYGPMMVLDSTARDMGVMDPARLAEPGLGIWYGTRYLGSLLRRFAGDAARAIAAYNAGPGNANRNQAGNFPNQTYVTQVLGFWKQFRGGALPAGALALGLVAIYLFANRPRRRAA